MINRIKKLAGSIVPEIIEIRHLLHQYPELSFQEQKTSAFIKSKLKSFGLNYQVFAETGVVTIIEGNNKENVIALRADMDALPLTEENDVPYKSKNPGVMHACGHDFHTASMLGVVRILNEIKDGINGSIKILFQPAEEKIPGGAKKMIEEGVLKDPSPDFILGQHVYPDLETGHVGFRGGMYMASTDEIYITVRGRGGHAAMPWKLVDPVYISAQLINSLQQLVSRNAPATIPTVLSFGKIVGNGATNIIPNEVRIEGTFRTFDEEWRKQAHENIERISRELVSSMGGKVDLEIRKGYPSLVNDLEKTRQNIRRAGEFLGAEKVHELDMRMTAEDFSYFTRELPGLFYRIGTSNIQKGINAPLHSTNFDTDDNAMEISIGLMSYLAYSELNER